LPALMKARVCAEFGVRYGAQRQSMCSNFGLNLHPGRKPCALQWQWYNFFSKLRRRFFPKALYMYAGRDARGPRGHAAKDERER